MSSNRSSTGGANGARAGTEPSGSAAGPVGPVVHQDLLALQLGDQRVHRAADLARVALVAREERRAHLVGIIAPRERRPDLGPRAGNRVVGARLTS